MTKREEMIRTIEEEIESWQDLEDGEPSGMVVMADTIRQVLEALKEPDEPKAPRVLTFRDVMGSCGGGWIERWYSAEDGDTEFKELLECAWCHGNVIIGGAEVMSAEQLKMYYDRKFGGRIWTAKPDPELQEDTPWRKR